MWITRWRRRWRPRRRSRWRPRYSFRWRPKWSFRWRSRWRPRLWWRERPGWIPRWRSVWTQMEIRDPGWDVWLCEGLGSSGLFMNVWKVESSEFHAQILLCHKSPSGLFMKVWKVESSEFHKRAQKFDNQWIVCWRCFKLLCSVIWGHIWFPWLFDC